MWISVCPFDIIAPAEKKEKSEKRKLIFCIFYQILVHQKWNGQKTKTFCWPKSFCFLNRISIKRELFLVLMHGRNSLKELSK